jgi:hypothetical protein
LESGLFVDKRRVTEFTNHFKEAYNAYRDLVMKRLSTLIDTFLVKNLRSMTYEPKARSEGSRHLPGSRRSLFQLEEFVFFTKRIYGRLL